MLELTVPAVPAVVRNLEIASLMPQSDGWQQLPSAPTWAWHGHNGHTAGIGGSYHLAHRPHTHSRWLDSAPWWRAQLRNPNVRLCVNVCAVSKQAYTIGIGLLTRILSFVWCPRATYWDCVYVCKCVWVMVNALSLSMLNSPLKVQKWPERITWRSICSLLYNRDRCSLVMVFL